MSSRTAETYKVRNPSTGEILSEVRGYELDKVKEIIDLAHSALDAVQSLSIAKRSTLLRKVADMIRAHRDELAVMMTREIGRPIKSSRGEIERTAQIFELAASEVRNVFEGEFMPLESYDYPAGNERRIAFIKREPLGVVGTITPFNFPASSFAHKVAPALAVGNTVVHKPTVLAPLTQMKISEFIANAGFPSGSVNVVTGNSNMIGKEFVENDKVRLISFTGSEKVGLDLASRAIARGKRSIMELGGSDAQIVLEDADIGAAADAAAFGRFDYAGQFCNATKRLIVRKEIAESFLRMIVDRVKAMKLGDPMQEDTVIGPMISESAVESMKEFVADAKRSGGKILFQGIAPDNGGYYFPPTVVRARGVSRITSEEVFGPVFPIIEAESDTEAVSIANSTDYGLDASIFTKDFSRAYKMASKLKVGTVMINDTTRLRWDNLPFGGVKKSGIGREGLRHTMMEMTETKTIEYNLG